MSARKPSELVPPGMHSFEEVSFIHPAPIRVTGFDTMQHRSQDRDVHTLRCRIRYWWVPFNDAKDQEPAGRLTRRPWVRIDYSLGCMSCYQAGHTDALATPGQHSIGSSAVWPVVMTCPRCGLELLTADIGPTITLVE